MVYSGVETLRGMRSHRLPLPRRRKRVARCMHAWLLSDLGGEESEEEEEEEDEEAVVPLALGFSAPIRSCVWPFFAA